MPLHRLYVCVTCVRDLPIQPGGEGRGRALAVAIEAELDAAELGPGLSFIKVPCLNGCLSPCNVALRAQGKFNLRFSRIRPEDARDVVALASEYLRSDTGDLREEVIPSSLRGKQSARMPPPHLMFATADEG